MATEQQMVRAEIRRHLRDVAWLVRDMVTFYSWRSRRAYARVQRLEGTCISIWRPRKAKVYKRA